jgi:hypothetical protein
MKITRRECAKLFAATPLAARAAEQEYALRSPALEFRLAAADGKIVSRRLTNRLTSSTVDLPLEDFELEFGDGLVLAPSSLPAKITAPAKDRIEALFSFRQAQVRVQYDLRPEKHYLRKQIAVRSTDGRSRRILRADLDNWRGVKRNWASMRADSLPYGSHPVFCEDLWAGVEFVAAFNEYGRNGFVLRSRPGGKRIAAEWIELRSTVAGVCEPGLARESFLEYIEDIRLAPARLVACYNSWWTLPKEVKQGDYLALMRELKEKLADRHGVFFDLVATDAGWSDRRSIWEVDRKNLPNGFADMRAIVEAAGGKAGLWMSPSEEYELNFDYDWAEKNGYVVLTNKVKGPWEWDKGVSLADPKYREQTKKQLARLIRENSFDHIKYDGFVAREDRGHHDLLPGDDSVEPLAEHSLELIRVSKEANPGLVTEPTYLNSFANYISPWIIRYADTVWGNSGGDCPLGLGAAPDYREAHTNAREHFIFTSLNEVWLPQNALQYFDIVHCDDEPGFASHAAMAFGRGRFFLSTYLNPKFLTDDDWRVYAGLLRWARKNQEILRNTTVAPSRIELGEPYAYGHWRGSHGILAVRNPSNESKEYALDLRKAGAPADLRNAVCYAEYPYRKGIASGAAAAAPLRIPLAPWELLFLKVVPRAELSEPVALNARWTRSGAGEMMVAPERTAARVLLLDPARGERAIALDPRNSQDIRGEVLAHSRRKLPESEWLSDKDRRAPTIGFELECSITVPEGAAGTALLLVEFPGRQHKPSRCSAQVNGAPAQLRHTSSAGHIGYYMPTLTSPWKDVMPYESEWSWYIGQLAPGENRVRFEGAAADTTCRFGVWAWAEWDIRARAFSVAAACPEAEMPQYRDHLERQGIRLAVP